MRTSEEGRAAFEAALDRVYSLFAPTPQVNIDEWADEHRVLPSSSAEPGQWRTSRVPYLRGILRRIMHPRTRKTVFIKSSQISYSEGVLNNLIAYWIAVRKKPILMVQDTLDEMKTFSKTRIAPMLDSCPILRNKVKAVKVRDGGNTVLLKEFPGGYLSMTGANSPKGLASRAVELLLMDEVDRFERDVGGEGSPVALAERRTTTFPRAKIVLGGTPTVKGDSPTEDEWEKSDQSFYWVPCPHCEGMQTLRWQDPDGSWRLRWTKNADGEHDTSTAAYACEHCGALIEERYKMGMLERGEWRATYPERVEIFGPRINSLYSPWLSWREIADLFLAARGNQELWKNFVNTILGETWKPDGVEVEASRLVSRAEVYRAPVPRGVGVLTAAVDVQGDRLEAKIMGYGAGEESWLIAWEVFFGDPAQLDVWAELDEWLLREWEHELGGKLRPEIVLVDAGDGNHSDSVYDFVQPRQGRRRSVFASAGRDKLTKPGLATQATARNNKIRLFHLATIAAKDRIFSRMLKVNQEGPGYMHIPLRFAHYGNTSTDAANWNIDEYCNQMTSETMVIERDKKTGKTKRYYKAMDRNEALDLEVYCLAGLFILSTFIYPARFRDLGALAESHAAAPPPRPAPTEPPAAASPLRQSMAPQRPQRSGWVGGWRS